jgi:DNA topoisomerase-3
VLRARFSSLAPKELVRAVQNLVLPNRCLADAVSVRQEIDLRVGAAFTRWQTQCFREILQYRCTKERRQMGQAYVVSYGPCQFPTVGFVVEAY